VLTYDQRYAEHPDYFGIGPDELLLEHWVRIDRRKRVLDLGAGQGRHALFLARQGLSVEAVDPSRIAVESLRSRVAEEGLELTVMLSDVESFAPEPGSYGALLLFGLVQELRPEQLRELPERLRVWGGSDALIFVTAHSTLDPHYAAFCARTSLGRNSFEDGRGGLRTFLEPGEILDLFDGFELVHHWEGMGPEHRHGDGPSERHGVIQVVFRS